MYDETGGRHLTKSFMSCIKSCELTIDACQKLINSCAADNLEECAAQTGVCIANCRETSATAAQCAEKSEAHGKACRNPTCREMMMEAAEAARAADKTCQEAIQACKQGASEHVSLILACIQACNDCAQAGQKCVDVPFSECCP